MDVSGPRGIFVFRARRPTRAAGPAAERADHLHVVRATALVLGGGKLGIAVEHSVVPALAQERDDFAVELRVARIRYVVRMIVPWVARLEAQIVEAVAQRSGRQQHGTA